MEEKQNFKNYVYVSSKVRAEMEEILRENNVYEIARFINTYDIELFFRDQLKNLNGVNFLILDLTAFPTSKENSIIYILKLIRQLYECRVIVIAEGYKQGDFLLAKIFNLGIYNIITSKNDIEFKELFKQTISNEGMSFGSAMKYQIEDTVLNIGNNKTVIKENYVRVKQTINIGIASTEKHGGATTLALNLLKYISGFDNTTACYIENNNHNTIIEFTNLSDAVHLEDKRMVRYKGLDLYLKPDNIADIQKYEYSFYIYDFGNFDEMTTEMKNNFMSRDLKLIVSGSQIWEEDKLADCLSKLGNDEQAYLFVNHIKNERRENFIDNLPDVWKERTYFSDLILDPLEVHNSDVYENILKPYLLNQNIITEKKKGFSLFGKRN